MVKSRRDPNTLDLLRDYTPPEPIVQRYDENRVRAVSFKQKVARAISETLSEADQPRGELAKQMSEILGEKVTVNMLNAYASPSRDDHNISYVRLIALVQVTGDARLLQIGADLCSHLVVDNKYVEWVELGMETEKLDRAQQTVEELQGTYASRLRRVRGRS